ncbi:UNVERIFIED_CONTAM: hypothetical protein GTU68_003376 [Idotea baltica]|nr:hypothetical protein [Idotea baltica]
MTITEMAVHLWKLFPTPSYKKLKAGHDVFLRIADEHIREAEAKVMAKNSQSGTGDHDSTLLEVLLQKEGLTRTDVVTIILDMLFAGIDTVGASKWSSIFYSSGLQCFLIILTFDHVNVFFHYILH